MYPWLKGRPRETGSQQVRKEAAGARRGVRTSSFKAVVLECVDNNLTTSTRAIAHEMSVLAVLILQQVQTLQPMDFAKHVEFCKWMLQWCTADENFIPWVIFTDKVHLRGMASSTDGTAIHDTTKNH
ncbi:hypothetical protein PR048_020876 [Dryococelus australis]|uniref:Uncharacterized protein n=1 Tax=Dryococelus australis TaxID=614101 RepID=A0ABQ9GWM5_9NEOP|nr:hypothetical protein PR048_020876 [Dryococelus australis]